MKLFQNAFLKHSLYYLAISLSFSWPIFFFVDAWLYPSLTKEGESVKALFLILGGHVLGMFAPAIAAIIISKFVLKQRLPVWKWGQPRHYVFGFVFMMSVWLLPAIVGFPIAPFELRNALKPFQWIYMGTYIGTVWFASVGEEMGWSSFLLSYLSPEFGKTRSVIISGIYRGVWHFPILISPFLYKVIMGEQAIIVLLLLSIAFLIQLVVSNVLFGALFGYVWFNTESLPLLGWMHFLFDLARDFSMFFIIGFGDSFFGKFGWAILFYGFAYFCLEKIMREEGITNIFKFIFAN